ncbi:MAG: type II toxin-antitoxin system VapC family toxin [Anaerolineae bacterium]|nr:type II toxin-antitoxin system VapC family toxin [Anaerolineae bacterium]
MIAYFVDTSALAKRYIAELGSVWLTAQIEPAAGNVVVISEQTLVELFSVFARRQREKNLAAADVAKRRAAFLLHMEQQYLVVPMDRSVLMRAGDLVDKHLLRSLDAMQLASVI